MMSLTITEAEKKNKQKLVICKLVLCLVHVIWTERQMSKLAECQMFFTFIFGAKFYNLEHIQVL